MRALGTKVIFEQTQKEVTDKGLIIPKTSLGDMPGGMQQAMSSSIAEIKNVVVAIGDGVKNVKVGDVIAYNPYNMVNINEGENAYVVVDESDVWVIFD